MIAPIAVEPEWLETHRIMVLLHVQPSTLAGIRPVFCGMTIGTVLSPRSCIGVHQSIPNNDFAVSQKMRVDWPANPIRE